jgi:alkylation response protein AidB-like acyl-CoA dehydrogenase
MQALLTEEERMLQATVRDFADRELAPRAAALDHTEVFPSENLRAMGALGLMGLTIPEAYGGAGATCAQLALAAEELARACAATSVIHLTHLSLGAETIVRFGTDEQRRRYLPRLASGEHLAAFALTEPSSGSDAADIQTRAATDGNDYVLDGNKTFITNGPEADVTVVFAATDRAARSRGVSTFVVGKGAAGLTITPQHGKLGMRASTTAELAFDGCCVPAADRLGAEGDGFHIAMSILDSSRITVAAQALGIGQAAFEAAVQYAQQRETFGKPLAEQQAIQFMLADMATRLDAARLLTRRAAQLKDVDQPITKAAAMAKLYASEAAHFACDKALQIHGGYGYFNESPVERLYRDQRVTEIYEGTSEIQRIVIARSVLKELAL